MRKNNLPKMFLLNYLHPSNNLHNLIKSITAHFFFLFYRFANRFYNRPQHFRHPDGESIDNILHKKKGKKTVIIQQMEIIPEDIQDLLG